jgi:hypothetical protein
MRLRDMINFSRAFDLAWERMMVILFRPFDLGKWFTIGFSAFLAGMLAGGNGFSGGSYSPPDKSTFSPSFQYNSNLPSLPGINGRTFGTAGLTNFLGAGMGIFLIAVIFFTVLAFFLLLYWLGARGQFLLLDNVVRNRGAIAWPWRTYARQGNSLFLFFLLCVLLILVVLVPFTVLGVFLAMPFFQQHHWPEGFELGIAVFFVLAYVAMLVGWSVIFFLFRELGVPLMFRNGLSARAAFVETWRLFVRHPGSLILFVLLRIALFIGFVVVSVVACCFTCCVEVLPYLGTVVLLPVIIYIKCFTLDFLAQFGPAYDVWTVDVRPDGPPTPLPEAAPTPPPPPG